MFNMRDLMSSSTPEQPMIDRLKMRISMLGILILAAFIALFSRLWFLQVLAADEFEALAQDNRIRTVHSEPTRGRVLDRNGYVLVDNRDSTVITVDREIVETPVKKRAVFERLSKMLKVPVKALNQRLFDVTVSPYKPVTVAYDVPLRAVAQIWENPENFAGVHVEERPVRTYPQGPWAAQILGYVGEITPDQLQSGYFRKARPRYQAGDIVGRSGLELVYDKQLRGVPAIEQLVVNSANKVVGARPVQESVPGADLVTTIDLRIQKIAEQALKAGVEANRVRYEVPDAAAVVLDPNTGGVVAMASYPTFDPAILADGLQNKEFNTILGNGTPRPEDDALLNRTIAAAYSPGSTFKVPTALSAVGLGVADESTFLDCNPIEYFGKDEQPFRNWSSRDFGAMGFARSLEVSCDTFYYQLGWEMEQRWGAGNGDETERFQEQLRKMGFDEPTGVDLPGERGGTIPDKVWLDELCETLKSEGCAFGWLPGYTVNMSIGQGDVITTPIQMAMNYAAVVNGGRLIRPHVADYFGKPRHQLTTAGEPLASPEPLAEPSTTASPAVSTSASPSGSPSPSATPTPSPLPSPTDFSTDLSGQALRADLDEEKTIRRVKPKVIRKLPVSQEFLEMLKQGLEDVVMGEEGTGRSAFSGFPLDRFPVAGKTGTAEVGGDETKNRAWFISYAPADDPQYVIAVYLNLAGHGGESAAPVARQIYEGIFGLDSSAGDVSLGVDESD